MTESPGPDQYDDVNETVGSEWEAETTPYERISTVIGRTYAPVSADTVAERARTSAKTARKHLETMASEGFVETEPGKHGGTLYRRSPESMVLEQAVDILAETPESDLERRVAEMRRKIEDFRTTYGAESPSELAVAQTNDMLSGEGRSGDTIDEETLREWQTSERNLAFANAALAIANARRFVEQARNRDGRRSPS